MSNKAADNVSSDVEQPTTNLSPDMPNYPVVQSNKDLALNEQPYGAAVESNSNDVQQAKTDLVAVATSSEPMQAKTQLFLDDLTEGINGTDVVMVCRSWDVHAVTGRYLSMNFVLSDAKGNAIHCTAKANIAHNFLKLKEGSVYLIRDFVVHLNKEEYRIFRDHAVILEFDGGNFSVTTYQRTGSRTLDFYLTNGRSQSMMVTLWGGLGDTLIEKKTKNVGLYPVVLTAMNVKQYSNKIYMSNSSSTQILDDPHIPAMKEFKKGIRIDNVRTKKGWNYPSCGGSKCKKGIEQKAGSFWCDSCNKSVEYPVLRFRLELDISDQTTSTVNVIRTTHILELKLHTYYEHGTFESFTCWRIVPEEAVEESACSSNIDEKVPAKRKRMKTLAIHPSVSTPSKPAEDKKKK
ncbi:reverse transcriptase domain-containing protein, partial [Tanacetum coccineum]